MEQRELIVLRKQREHNKTIVTECSSEKSVVVVCKLEHNYYVYRYFTLSFNGEWLVSVDASECSADEAFVAYTKAMTLFL